MSLSSNIPDLEQAAESTAVDNPTLAGFQWCRVDTLTAVVIALLIVLAYYPMSLLGKIPMDRDTLTFFYPLLSCFDSPTVWLWNPYQLAGCGMIDDPQAGLFYPPNWIFFILPTDVGYIVSTLGHYYLGAFGVYLLARFSRLSPMSALVAACVFCFGGYMTSRLLLRPLVLSAAWFPYVFLGYLYGHYRNVLLGYLFAGVALALQLLAGMPHNAVYSAVAFGVFALYKTVVELPHVHNWRIWSSYLYRYLVFLTVGLLLASVVILPTLEVLPHTVRTWFGYEEATSNSLPWKWLPDIFVGAHYCQAQAEWTFNETNCYLGVIAIWLILFALLGHWRKGVFWFYVGLVGLSLSFALGKNSFVFRLFYHFPYLQSLGVPTFGRFFDIPSRFLGLTAFAMAMLAGYGMEVLGEIRAEGGWLKLPRRARSLIRLLGASSLIWLFVLLAILLQSKGELLTILSQPASRSETARLFSYANFSIFTLVFGLFSIAYLLGYLRQKVFQVLLVFALVADLLHTGTQVNVDYGRPDEILRPPVIVRYLQERADRMMRVMAFDSIKNLGGDIKYTRFRSTLMPKLGLLYRVQDVAGYDPLILRRYSELVQRTTGMAPGETPLRVVAWKSPNGPLLDLLRVGYVIGEVNEKPVFEGLMILRPGEHRKLKVDLNRLTDEIRFRSVLGGGLTIKQNTQVGKIVLRDASGEEMVFPIRAGVETADFHVEAAHFHHPATAFRTWHQIIAGQKIRVHHYVCRLPFPYLFQPVEMEFHNQSQATLAIHGAALRQLSTGRFELAFEDLHRTDRLYRNKTACPPVWWVHDAYVGASPKEILNLMERGHFSDNRSIDYRQTALLEQAPLHLPTPSPTVEGDSVELLTWQPEQIIVEAESNAPGLLVFSEMNYPGWQAWLDGAPAEILVTNYILRGISLPAGKHRVEMRYQPRSLFYSLLASLLAAVLVLCLFFRYRRRFPVRQY